MLTPKITLLESPPDHGTRLLRGHLAELRKRAALRWQYPETSQLIIVLAGWLFHNDLNEGLSGTGSQTPVGRQPGTGQKTPLGRDARGRFLPPYDDEDDDLLIHQDEFHPPHPIDSLNDSAATVQKSARTGANH